MWRFPKEKRHVRVVAPLYTNWRTAIGADVAGFAGTSTVGIFVGTLNRKWRISVAIRLDRKAQVS
jgi:hypothetical protein